MSPHTIALAIAAAVLPFVAPPGREAGADRGDGAVVALELGNNLATVVALDPAVNVAVVAERAIRHRIAHQWIACGDVAMTVRVIEQAVLALRKDRHDHA